MFLYTDFDQNLLNERVAQFRDQTQRYLEGKLTEEEYRPLRLQNGFICSTLCTNATFGSALWLNELSTTAEGG